MKRRVECLTFPNHSNGFTKNMNNHNDDHNGKQFFSEITDMMHYYGDVANPSKESVEYMYSILREQINVLLIKAENNMDLLGISQEKEISHREILLLMMQNKPKLNSLLEFLSILDVQPTLPKAPETDEDDSDDFDETVCEQRGKRVKMCNKFLRHIFDGEELSFLENKNIVDPATHRRLMQQNAATARMNQKEYLEFSGRIVKATFCPRQRKETFKEWLLKDQVTLKGIAPTALSIIEFLARETIAQIIDVALYIKSKKVRETLLVPYDEITHQVETVRSTENHLQSSGFSEKRTENEQDISIPLSESNDKQATGNNQINQEHEDCTMKNVADDDVSDTSDSDTCYDVLDADDSDFDENDFVFIEDDSDSLKTSESDSAGSPDESHHDSKSEAEASKKRKLESTAEIENTALDISSDELMSSALKESVRRSQEFLSKNSQSKYVSSEVENTKDSTEISNPELLKSSLKESVRRSQEFLPKNIVTNRISPNEIEDLEISNTSNSDLIDSCLQESNNRDQSSTATTSSISTEEKRENVSENRLDKQDIKESHIKNDSNTKNTKTSEQTTETYHSDSSNDITSITTDPERILNYPKSAVYHDRDTIVEKKDKYAIIPKTAITPAEIKEAYRLFLGVSHINSIIEKPNKISDKIKLICLQDSTKFTTVK